MWWYSVQHEWDGWLGYYHGFLNDVGDPWPLSERPVFLLTTQSARVHFLAASDIPGRLVREWEAWQSRQGVCMSLPSQRALCWCAGGVGKEKLVRWWRTWDWGISLVLLEGGQWERGGRGSVVVLEEVGGDEKAKKWHKFSEKSTSPNAARYQIKYSKPKICTPG